MRGMAFKAVVKGGRAVIEKLEEFPDGTILEFDLVDDGLDDAERERLHASLERAFEEEKAGLGRSADDVLRDL